MGCLIALIVVMNLNRFSRPEVSLAETSVYQKVRSCLPSASNVKKTEYIVSLNQGNVAYHYFEITQKMPVFFKDNIVDVTRQTVIQTDDIGCLIIMPVEKSEDSMTLYLPEQIAFDLLEQKIKKDITQSGGIKKYINKIKKAIQIDSMDENGDSDIYILPEYIYVEKKLGIPLPKSYIVIDSFTKAPEYVPMSPYAFPEDKTEGSLFLNKPNKPSRKGSK
jgi:hypothetical protein